MSPEFSAFHHDRRGLRPAGSRSQYDVPGVSGNCDLKWKGIEGHPDGDFYVRSGPKTIKLPPDSAKEYIRTRFALPAKEVLRDAGKKCNLTLTHALRTNCYSPTHVRGPSLLTEREPVARLRTYSPLTNCP